MSVRTAIDLTPWQWFVLWIEDDATQLGMEVATYYAYCSLYGALTALAQARAWGLW